jgi:hypothetical protein
LVRSPWLAIRRWDHRSRRPWFPASCIERLDRPFVVLLEEDGADEPDDGVVVGEDADDLGPALGRVKKECVTVAPSTVEAWARLSEEVRRYMRSKAG